MINIQDLTKYYGDLLAVDQINFEIRKGEVLGLLGPNGAGKSSTLRMLTCFMKPTEGNITVKDYNIFDHSLEIKKLIGYLPESAPLYQDMIVYDYLSYVGEIRALNTDQRASQLKKVAELCGLREVMHKAIHELSRGYKQRVGLAHAMPGAPEILVLDEPTAGLDPNQIVEIRGLIKEIGKEKTVILSTHILSEAEATCDRIVIINKGKIVADGATDQLKQDAGNAYEIHLSLMQAQFDAVKNALAPIGDISSISQQEDSNGALNLVLSCRTEKDIRPDIYQIIKKNEWLLLEFHRKGRTLENIFRELTKEN